MKKQICLLFMFLICVACGDEFKEVTPEGTISSGNVLDGIFEKIAPQLKDTTGFDRETMICSHDVAFCIKDGKLWIALFENDLFSDNPILKKEWLSSFTVPAETKRILLSDTDLSQTDNGYICLTGFAKDESASSICFYLLNLPNDGDIQIVYEFEDPQNTYWVNYAVYGDHYILNFGYNGTGSNLEEKSYLLSPDGIITTNVTVTNEGDSYFFTGWQNDKLRVDVYDESTGDTKNWISKTAFDKTLSVHQGYGEYINYNIDSVRISDILPMDWGYVASPTYRTDEGWVNKDLLILNDQGDIIRKETEKYDYITYCDWYNNSFLIQYPANGKWHYIVVSPNGEEILNVEDHYFNDIENLEPVSYDELIEIQDSYSDEWIISRYNLRDQTTRWETQVDVLSANMESDAKLSATIHKNGNIWQYECDILYYDGSTRQVTFTINIETGALL